MRVKTIGLKRLWSEYSRQASGVPATVDRRWAVYRGLVAVHGEAIGVRDLTPRKINRWLESLDVTRGTAGAYLGILREVLRWGAERELVPVQVWHAAAVCRPPAKLPTARKTVRSVDSEVFEKTLGVLKPHIAAILRAQRLTGSRVGEILSLTVDQVDRSGPVWWYRPISHKRLHVGSPRLIAVGPRTQEVLAPWWDQLPWGLRYYQVYDAVKRACDQHGWPRWHPHQLRHASGSEVRTRYGRDAVGFWLGHVSKRTVSDRYTLEAWEDECRALLTRIALEIG